MANIDVPNGEATEIAESTTPGMNYQIRVLNSDIRIASVESYASDGVLVDSTTDALIQAPEDTAIYAYGDSGNATVEINKGAYNQIGPDENPEITLMPSSTTSISGSIESEITAWSAGTLAVEQQTPIGVEDTTGTAIDPATDGTLSSELSREISNWTAGQIGTTVEDWNAGTLPVSMGSNPANVHTETIAPASGGSSFTAQAVPDGQEVVYRADPSNGATIELEGFPLAAGEHVSLAIDDVSTPTFTGDGSAQVHAITEVN
jgi:hypothetical protein